MKKKPSKAFPVLPPQKSKFAIKRIKKRNNLSLEGPTEGVSLCQKWYKEV